MHPRTQSRPHWQRYSRPRGPSQPLSLVDRMVEDLIDLQAEGEATRPRMLERGYTPAELEAHETEARSRANTRYLRKVETPAYDRQQRLAQARVALGEVLPSRQFMVTELQARGFAKPELDDIFEEAIAAAADDFRATSRHPGLNQ